MEDVINQLIENKCKRYREDYSEMLGDYNRELETVRGYNGRQILELLQNCDDEGSNEVLIRLDKENKTISIANDGTPFSEKGYRSLFIANLSSKTSKRKYIGNKGLGFRSIINWSSAIEIQSNNLSLQYSEENRLQKYGELFSEDLQSKIRNEENLGDNIVPMPFLAIPKPVPISQLQFATCIVVHYKENFYDKIIKQIDNITPETLLFLNNIKSIRFEGFENKDDILCDKESVEVKEGITGPGQKVLFKDSSWFIFELESDLPVEYSETDKDEKEFYQIKIAVEETFQKSSPYLYSYFPTNIKLKQPYVLHATFDLDATRNQINDSPKNRYILERIVEFTISVAKYFSNNGQVSYQPLEILSHKHSADTLANLGYYDLINKAIESEEVFPCIDNRYRALKQVIYINDPFATMLTEIGAANILGLHLQPLGNKSLASFNLTGKVYGSLANLVAPLDAVNRIAALNLNLKQRALFISQILKNCQFLKSKFENQVNFLVNKERAIVPGNDYIYTPVTKNNDLLIPSFTNIQIINDTLFNYLVEYLAPGSKEGLNKSRFIYEQLKGYCNIHSYEPATLAIKIVSETNNILKEKPENGIENLKEMNRCLFHNFRQLDEETKKSPLRISVPTLNRNNRIISTDEVSLSDSYPSGQLNRLIFKDVFDDENYVASPVDLGITDNVDPQEVENYLRWINVNTFVKYKSVVDTTDHHYFNFVKKSRSCYDSTGHKLTYLTIPNLEFILSKISLNQLILWVYFDERLRKQIDDRKNEDVIKNHYRYWYNLSPCPSFIKYRITTQYSYDFNQLLLDEKYTWANSFIIDYRAKEFTEFKISKSSINEILTLLGAKDDFNELPILKVAEVINKLPEMYPDGKKSQTIYKKALSHYKNNQEALTIPVNLFADTGSGLKLFPQSKIYFSDKIRLPKQLRKDFPVFNFPSRAGGVDAIKFFKIKDLRGLHVHVTSHDILPEITDKFKSYFEKLKPLILTHRINAIHDPDQQKIQASICNSIRIEFCSEISYQVQGLDYEVADYEFLHVSEYAFLIKVKSYDSFKGLQKNLPFLESFADIIALSFDVSSERNEFKNLLRDSYEDSLLNIEYSFGKDTLNDAKDLLGLTDYKHAFWLAVLVSKGIQYNEKLDDLALEKIIYEEFDVNIDLESIDYENINQLSELLKVEELFNLIDLKLTDFAKVFAHPISFAKRHFNELTNLILANKKLIKSSIWKSLQSSDFEKQACFLSEIDKYEDYHDFVEVKSVEYKHSFNVDYAALVHEFINGIYGIIVFNKEFNLDQIKRNNLRQFDKNEQREISQNERFKSLIYFENALGQLKSELKVTLEPEDHKDSTDTEDIAQGDVELGSSDSLAPKPNNEKSKKKKRGVYTPSANGNTGAKDKGNRAEQWVYEFLLKNDELKDVYLASEDNEGLHYDIRYVNSTNQVKYVEVKSFDQGFFHLSKDQYSFGKEHQDNYEIWLVLNPNKFIPIFDFFSNPKYELIPNEYLIHLDVIND